VGDTLGERSERGLVYAGCEAVGRPTMRFVPIKNAEQQSVLSLHRVRQAFVKAGTAQANQIRGPLVEYGLIVPEGLGFVATRVSDLVEDASNKLPGLFRQLIVRLLDHLKLLDQQVDEIELQTKAWHRDDQTSQKPQKVPGIGPISCMASASWHARQVQ
jgi:transposase